MQLPLEISFHGTPKSEPVEALIREKAEKLGRFHKGIMSCRVVVEHPHKSPKSGSGYRVRLDLTVPPGHEIAVVREPGEGLVTDDLGKVVHEAFEAARRQLVKLNEKQRGDVKVHPQGEVRGFVSRLFDDYGFIQPAGGGEVYFHRNSVVGADFDEIEVGMGVSWAEEPGEEGPQASSVRVIEERRLRPPPTES